MPISRREVYLDQARVTIECARLVTDEELAEVLAAFVDQVRARPPRPSLPVTQERSSPLPAFRGRKRR
jgi:hypothetical protein